MKTKRSGLKKVVIPAMVVAFFVALSFVGSNKDNPQKLAFDASGYNKVYAAEASWGGVRGAATLVRGARNSLEVLFASMSALAPITSFLTGTINVLPLTDPGYYLRLSDANTTVDANI